VTETDLRDVSDAKEEALRQWDARLAAIFEEYETHPPRLRPLREAVEERLLRAFAGLINQLRQQDPGIERFIWRSRDDAKVRDSHAVYDDQVFRWDEPPEGGHPGQAHNCRCYAEPVAPGSRNDVIRVERTLPAEIVTELRRIVGAVIAAHDAGDRIALRINLPIADSAGQTDHGIETRNNTTGKAKPEQARSTPPMDRRAKKRAQTARRRARAAAEGKTRATFEIPAALRGELTDLLDRAASALAQGANVSVEPDIAGHMAGPQAPSDDTPPPGPESQPTLHHSDRRSDSPYQKRQETPLTDLFATENTKADTLFWDIKAAGRI
jgi:SPP1 gp7 family putative phage head morphogenesis protein